MSVAAVTFVFNEAVNLPIWLDYYGGNFGRENLFVVDRESTDGSTDNLGSSNKIRLPHIAFDEDRKTDFISLFHAALLRHFDAVIYTDCDEIIVPDPDLYTSLNDYIEKKDFDYVSCVGLNILHILNQEAPLDLARPILLQRHYAQFWSAACKTLLSRTPITWAPGFHSQSRPPQIDPNLFMFHMKFMDYSIAMQRQVINRETEWSQESLARNIGTHHRFENDRFVRGGFLVHIGAISQGTLPPFEFSDQIAELNERTTHRGNIYNIPMDIKKYVEIPERFRSIF